MDNDTIDIIADPAIVSRIMELAKSNGFIASKPMPPDSISDALDAPFGMDEIKTVLELVTLVASTGGSVVTLLAGIKALLATSETSSGAEPEVRIAYTKGQRKIGKITKNTDLSKLRV